MMRKPVLRMSFVLAGIVCLCNVGCQKKELEPTPPEPARVAAPARPTPQFNAVTGAGEEVQEARLTTQALPQLHSRLEIATIIVQAGKPITLPMQYEGLLELRAGSVASGAGEARRVHHRGDMWQVGKGERVTLQAFGELAVVRAIYLVPGDK